MSTGCCMETNVTINFIYLKKKKKKEGHSAIVESLEVDGESI